MSKKRLITVLAMVTVLLAVAVAPSAADHGGPHVELLARGAFVDQVAATFRVKVDDERTFVHQATDASDVVVARLTIPPGGQIAWHSHSGPVFGVNVGPGTLTSFHGDDCMLRDFPPGSVVFDRGQNTVHGAFNGSGQEVVVYATFLGLQGAPLIPAQPPAGCHLLP